MNNTYKGELVFNNERTEALDEAYSILISTLKDYSKNTEVSEDFINEFKDLIEHEYKNKRASYYFASKVNGLQRRLDNMVSIVFNSSNKKADYTRLFYLNHSNIIRTNE